MIYHQTHSRIVPLGLLFALLLGTIIYNLISSQAFQQGPAYVFATKPSTGGPSFSYQLTDTDLTVDWPGGGDFDPRDKCPEDFFAAGFIVICKKVKRGGYFKFLYHKKKKLLYRIDEDVINGKARIGLHWVEGTHFGAKYRIADAAYKGGKAIPVPDGKGGKSLKVFQYGEAVSKKRVARHRELYQETHLNPKQCEEWWNIFNFIP